jgi:hypothetical protein
LIGLTSVAWPGDWGFGRFFRIRIKGVCLGADCFAFGELLDKAPSNQGLVLLVGPFLRQGSFTPVSLRGPAPNGHPCPDGALAASMRLGPLRETSVQPAPKSRFVSFEPFAYEDQDQTQIKGFPAKASPTGHRVHSVGPALAGKRPAQAPIILLTAPPTCGSELARECCISITTNPADVPTTS